MTRLLVPRHIFVAALRGGNEYSFMRIKAKPKYEMRELDRKRRRFPEPTNDGARIQSVR
jgi:hypothetical protein